jgi:hypothetical protein
MWRKACPALAVILGVGLLLVRRRFAEAEAELECVRAQLGAEVTSAPRQAAPRQVARERAVQEQPAQRQVEQEQAVSQVEPRTPQQPVRQRGQVRQPAGGDEGLTGRGEGLTGGPDELVDLVSAVLVDPNLHTDLRMRLAREIGALLQAAHRDPHGGLVGQTDPESAQAPEDHLPSLLRSVLVDPDLHTDLRMRLYREIPELVRAAHEQARSEPPGASR